VVSKRQYSFAFPKGDTSTDKYCVHRITLELNMSMQALKFKDTLHYHHHGVKSKGHDWALNDARLQIISPFARFMASMSDTSNVAFEEINLPGNGGNMARLGSLDILSVPDPRSHTENSGARSWDFLATVHYEITMYSFPTSQGGPNGPVSTIADNLAIMRLVPVKNV
jgi:hypothetical protein